MRDDISGRIATKKWALGGNASEAERIAELRTAAMALRREATGSPKKRKGVATARESPAGEDEMAGDCPPKTNLGDHSGARI